MTANCPRLCQDIFISAWKRRREKEEDGGEAMAAEMPFSLPVAPGRFFFSGINLNVWQLKAIVSLRVRKGIKEERDNGYNQTWYFFYIKVQLQNVDVDLPVICIWKSFLGTL